MIEPERDEERAAMSDRDGEKAGPEGNGDGREGADAPLEPPAHARIDVLYRVFAVKKAMPPLETLLKRLTGGNPYNPPEGGYVFPPGAGMRRLQDALGASPDYFVMGYHREEAPTLWEELAAAYPAEAPGFDDDDHLIVRNANLCVVIRAQLVNPEDNMYLETLCHLADAFRDLQRGVVWDVRMGRIWGEREWADVMQAPLSPLSHVQVERSGEGPERILRTRGLVKFGSPELEVKGGPAHLEREIEGMLLDAAHAAMRGDIFEPDEAIEVHGARLRAVAVEHDEQGAVRRLRLVDDPGPEAEHVDPERGMQQGFKALQAAREAIEGKRWEWQW
ncbi:MAG: hypothetical protein D6776_06130 [Planctomycetota bacterium]|nr:MAG: hypothetical protein D6776_06130 [Planctomycetota bacterium]